MGVDVGKREFSALAEPTREELESLVLQLKEKERKWMKPRSRNALFEFLNLVLRIYDECARWSNPEKNTGHLKK